MNHLRWIASRLATTMNQDVNSQGRAGTRDVCYSRGEEHGSAAHAHRINNRRAGQETTGTAATSSLIGRLTEVRPACRPWQHPPAIVAPAAAHCHSRPPQYLDCPSRRAAGRPSPRYRAPSQREHVRGRSASTSSVTGATPPVPRALSR
jgi:hypothetical protein